ncbi:MAG: hypothetical protein R2939_10205 [Kofleriaceae bacterium]
MGAISSGISSVSSSVGPAVAPLPLPAPARPSTTSIRSGGSRCLPLVRARSV